MTNGISKGWWCGFAIFTVFFIAVFQVNVVLNGQVSTNRANTAILRVMKADKVLSEKLNSVPPNLSPNQIAWYIEQYCYGLERLDMTDCPADFRIAYKHHMRAWKDTHHAVKELPDTFIEGFFVGFFNTLLRGEIDGGASRLEGNIRQSRNRIRTTWEEVEKIAAKQGVVF